MSDMSAAEQFATELRHVYEAAGRPTYAALINRARKQQLSAGLNSKTLSDWFGGKSVPKNAEAVRFLIDHLEALAEQRGGYRRRRDKWWQNLHQRAWDEKHANRGGRPKIEPDIGLAATRPQGSVPARPNHETKIRRPVGRDDDPQDAPPHRVPDGWSVPRQLPAPAGLAGRHTERARIRSALLESRPATGPRVVGIDGIAGVGKSAIAVAAAHACAATYPDGQLYVDLQGASPGMNLLNPGEVLARFLRALDVPPDRISPDTDEAAAQFRSVTATKRILIVLDNARDLTQVRLLIPAGQGSATVITSRTSMVTLAASIADVILIHLDPLDRAASVDLLRRHLGERVDHEPVAAAELADLCGYLPLALRVIGARLWARPGRALSSEVARLRSARRRLDELEAGDLDVRSSLALSLENLRAVPQNGPAAAKLIELIGVLRTSQITLLAASALIATDEPTTQRLLDLLVDHCLLTPLPDGHHLHDLLRVYAVEQAEAHPDDSEAAIQRVVDHYIDTMTADPALYLTYIPLSSDLTDRANGASAVSTTDAAAWLSEHLPTVGALVEHLASNPRTIRRAHELLWPVAVRLTAHHPADYIRLCRLIIAGAAKAADYEIATSELLNIINAHVVLGRLTQARRDLEQARSYLPMTDDDRLRARLLGAEAGVHSLQNELRGASQDDLHAALQSADEAAALFERLGFTGPQATMLTLAGKALLRLDQIEDARAAFERSIALEQQLSGAPRPRSSSRLYYLALVHLRTGRLDDAKQVADDAVALAETSGDHPALVLVLALRADVWLAMDRVDEAIADAEAAVANARGLADGRPASLYPLLQALQSYSAILWRSRDRRAHAILAEVDAAAAELRATAAEQDTSAP